MKQQTRGTVIGVVVGLFLLQMVVQHQLDPKIRELHKGEKTAVVGLSNEFILGPMLGLQQAVAGALWVRADEFFHEGDYDAILPMVRMVTWLDPHQLDVYITGAWHLAYNFTDSNERSDRRYIPASQKLLEEGYDNNKDLYDIPFEAGWENNDKLKDYERAEQWYRIARAAKSADIPNAPLQDAPGFVTHQLAHSLERQGRIDESVAIWREALTQTLSKMQGKLKDDFVLRSLRDTEKHNMELTLKRKFSRFTHEIDFAIDAKRTRSINEATGEPSPADSFLSQNIKNGPIGKPSYAACARPWNAAFETVDGKGHTTVQFTSPRVLEPRGVFNVGDGARVTVRLHDDDWHQPQLKDFTFDVDQSVTVMMDQHSVRSRAWGRKIDMSKDPKMYGFTRPYYYLVFEFDPRQTSPFIQDKFGWNGEGMTDPKYLWIIKSDKPGQPDTRILRKVYKISRDQIMAVKPITEKDVVSNEEYAKVETDLAAKAIKDAG